MEFQQFLDLSSALLTPVIALSMLYIAYQQWQINKINLRKELYDERLSIYESTIELIYTVQSLGYANNDHIIKFNRSTSNSVFLFGEDTTDYLKQVNNKALRLKHSNEAIQRLSKNVEKNVKKLDDLSNIDTEIFTWFMDQPIIVENLFKKYLDLSKN